MKWRNDEVEEALQQLEEVDELREENQRLNNTIKKLKNKQGDKDSNIEVSIKNYIVVKDLNFPRSY